MDGNEAHNNGKYGLRIFTGSNHNGEGLPGFYPRKVDSCAPVSETNPFEPADFTNFFSWRNGTTASPSARSLPSGSSMPSWQTT